MNHPKITMSEDVVQSLTTGQFLSTYFSRVPSGFVEITYLAPEGVRLYPKTITKWRPLPIGTVDDHPTAIRQANQTGYSVFFGTTVSGVKHDPEQRTSDKGTTYTFYPRRKEADVTYAPALWVDVDGVSAQDGLKRLYSLPITPNIVVKSGGGVHGYWLLIDPVAVTLDNKTELKRVLHGVANASGGDTKARDLARIMRLPGTVNTKPERKGATCEVIGYTPGYYHYDQLRQFFLKHAPREILTPTRHIPTACHTDGLPPVTKRYLESPPRTYRNNGLYAAARGCNDAQVSVLEAIRLLSPAARSTGLEDREIERTIQSAYDAPSTPQLPSRLAMRMAAADRMLKGAAR